VTRATRVHRATGPNQVWSWDITYLPTLIRGRFLHLYLVLDVWSRHIVGTAIHEGESATHAAALIRRICEASAIDPHGLVLHSDNGKPMRGHTMIATLPWLGIVPSFSRPHVSNDNPYSEALFRTLKETPAYPREPFSGLDAARRWVAHFVAWYNGAVRFASSRRPSATWAPTWPFSRAATPSMPARVANGPNDGRATHATGPRSPTSC
jgi:transposase InsO family protein